MNDVLSVILGGGRGSRLFPLTLQRSKPAVPIAGKYRLIDIPISNCLNSGLRRMFVLTQFNSESLNKHVSLTYKFDLFSTPSSPSWPRSRPRTTRLVPGHGGRGAAEPAPPETHRWKEA
jgi:ADP-glucose pyrophosphorylase